MPRRKAKPGQRIVIDIPPADRTLSPEAAERYRSNIAFEDEEMLVIDKQAGPCGPSRRRQCMTGTSRERAALRIAGSQLSGIGGVQEAWHRPSARQGYQRADGGSKDRPSPMPRSPPSCKSRTLKRIYNAVVWGKPETGMNGMDARAISAAVPTDRKHMAVVEQWRQVRR